MSDLSAPLSGTLVDAVSRVRTRLEDADAVLSDALGNPSCIIELFDRDTFLSPEIVKAPRWPHDSLIIKFSQRSVSDRAHPKIAVKIHEEIFPIGSHLYDSPIMLERLASCPHAATVFASYVVSRPSATSIRVVLFQMIEGQPLGRVLRDGADIDALKELLRVAVRSLLDLGVHPILRDLDDFQVVETDTGTRSLIVTDYNALVDCSRSTAESRADVMLLIARVIDRLLTTSYEPYRGVFA